MSDYPEHDKLSKVSDESQAQGEFVEWLSDRGLILGQYVSYETDLGTVRDRFTPACRNVTDLLAEYHGIDPVKLEHEKRAMLAALRAS